MAKRRVIIEVDDRLVSERQKYLCVGEELTGLNFYLMPKDEWPHTGHGMDEHLLEGLTASGITIISDEVIE